MEQTVAGSPCSGLFLPFAIPARHVRVEADVHGSYLPWRHGLVAYVPLWYGLVRSRRSRTVWYALGGLGVLKRSGQGCPPIRRSSGACVQSVRSVGIVKSVGIVSSVAKVRINPHTSILNVLVSTPTRQGSSNTFAVLSVLLYLSIGSRRNGKESRCICHFSDKLFGRTL